MTTNTVPHVHQASSTHSGHLSVSYEFCSCKHVRVVWIDGTVLDWHKPSAEKAAEARAIHARVTAQ